MSSVIQSCFFFLYLPIISVAVLIFTSSNFVYVSVGSELFVSIFSSYSLSLFAKICSYFEFKSAYIQVKHLYKTAFNLPWGLYKFIRIPFGLVNSPATFQRITYNLFKDEIYKFIICYLDDVVVYSKTYEEHLEHVEIILKRLEKVGPRLNSTVKSVNFL